jgi:hypothetical protein
MTNENDGTPLDSGAGRVNLNRNMTHPAGTGTIDFYAQKRALEAELGRSLTYREARDMILARGTGTDPRADTLRSEAGRADKLTGNMHWLDGWQDAHRKDGGLDSGAGRELQTKGGPSHYMHGHASAWQNDKLKSEAGRELTNTDGRARYMQGTFPGAEHDRLGIPRYTEGEEGKRRGGRTRGGGNGLTWGDYPNAEQDRQGIPRYGGAEERRPEHAEHDAVVFGTDLFGHPIRPASPRGPLAVEFVWPPFSVFNAQSGAWQERKRAWLSLGIRGEEGRDDNAQPIPGGGTGANSVWLFRSGDGKYESLKESGKTLENILDSGAGRELHNHDTRGFYLQGRAEKWKDEVKLKSEDGRPAGLHPNRLGFTSLEQYDGVQRRSNGTSVFDPVLCELVYRWFCPPEGLVLDPFAGGSVRGVVASILGRRYVGVELSERQVAANYPQAEALCGEPMPEWIVGDSRELEALWPTGELADCVFTCPPYADLERYSEDPRDISTMPYAEFLVAYRTILSRAAARLKPDRFACVVVGEVRDPKTGVYRGLVADTITAMRDAGLEYYNDAILVTAIGSLPVRAAGIFRAGRKLGKTHQNVLIFVKGDWRRATAAIIEAAMTTAATPEPEAATEDELDWTVPGPPPPDPRQVELF